MLNADYVFTPNNDIMLGRDTIKALVRCAEETGAAIVQPIAIELHDHVRKHWNALSKLKYLSKAIRIKNRDSTSGTQHRCTNGAGIHFISLKSTTEAYPTLQKIKVNVFPVEQIKRYIRAILSGDPRILKYYYTGIRDTAREKYGRREDLPAKCKK